MAKSTKKLKHMNSPFFAPSTPRKLVQVSTPGGTAKLIKKETTDAKEHKSSIVGATSNLVNAIIGAGIVGIPFAIRETGLVAGCILVVLCAFLTGKYLFDLTNTNNLFVKCLIISSEYCAIFDPDKSLRVLVGTAKHVDVPSYETLFESTYGSFGFYFISVNMLIMAYGGCLSYLTIIKDTLPVLLGVEKGDVGMQRSILTLSTLCIILPISMQRVSLLFSSNALSLSIRYMSDAHT
jgi:sodium-coupled neutral amino acid transporter 11